MKDTISEAEQDEAQADASAEPAPGERPEQQAFEPRVAVSDAPTIARRPAPRTRSSVPSQPPSLSGARSISPIAAAGSVSRASTGGSSSSGHMSEVLQAEEATRSHGFAGFISIVGLLVTPLIAMVGGNRTAQLACIAAILFASSVSVWVWRRTHPKRGAQRYERDVLRVYAWALAFAVIWVEYYVGFFSPVTVVITLGIYYFGQSIDRLYSMLLPLVVLGSYIVLATLTALGVLDDAGLFAANDTPLQAKLFVIVACSAVLVSAMFLARVSRRALHEAIDASREAWLVAQQRAAQLAEANHQLDRALRIAVGKPGRYTGQLAGEHLLDVIIGVGAIGEVYAASSTRTGEQAAVKLLQSDALERPDLVERFLREGDIAKRIDSPHVARVVDVGRLLDGAPYIAMERLKGRDLATRLRQDGRLSPGHLELLALHLSSALESAHAAGVVHRDLKPLNVYEVEQAGPPLFKLLDFGISKVETSTGTLTRHGLVGTPGYMSPEQARGIEVDHRSDVFSMGVVLYRAATGQPAFSGDNTPQILFDIVYKSPARPSTVVKELTRELDLVLALALAKDPDDRFQSTAELARAFVLGLRGEIESPIKARAHEIVRKHPWGRGPTDLARGAAP
jgi:serine/threonine-protein kinase